MAAGAIDHRQAQPHAGAELCILGAGEFLEDALLIGIWMPMPVSQTSQHHAGPAPPRAQQDAPAASVYWIAFTTRFWIERCR